MIAYVWSLKGKDNSTEEEDIKKPILEVPFDMQFDSQGRLKEKAKVIYLIGKPFHWKVSIICQKVLSAKTRNSDPETGYARWGVYSR